ncbi:MAG: diguanylate cyclase [Anaerolineales bacterium]|nr:diguanylate cyclase [Anaerolineales bacterium]
MELNLYLQMLRRGWWVVALTALVALTVSLGASFLVTPQYEVLARFIISPGAIEASPNTVLQGLSTVANQSVMETYAEVMNSNRIYDDALSFLQLQPEDIKDYSYESAVLPGSSILELTVTGPDPQLAAEIANAVGYQTIDFTRRLNQVINLDFLDLAVPTTIPSSPQPLRNAALAIILGVIGGLGFVFVREQLRASLETFRQRVHLDNETGVYTKKYFSRWVEDELARQPNEVLSIGIVELNGLRDIVDTFPIVALQRILQRVTEFLRKELRGNDIIGRWNGNSFIVMLPNTPGVAANRIFERIFQALSEPVKLDQFNIVVNLDAHIGGAEYGNHITVQELFEKANSALEQARRDNEVPVYVWEMKSPFWAQKNLDST